MQSFFIYQALDLEKITPHDSDRSFDPSWVEAMKYIGLVKRIARGYLDSGLEFDDLVHEGLFGAKDVIDRYGHRTDIKVSSYVGQRIHNYLQKAIYEKGCVTYLPPEAYFNARRLASGKEVRQNITQRELAR